MTTPNAAPPSHARWPFADMQARLPLPATGKWPLGVFDVDAFARDGISLSLFAPRGGDFQTAHARDEFYIVVGGRAELHVRDPLVGETVLPAQPGDALFVAAGIEHRFHAMSDDFATWVVFFPAASKEPT